MEISGSNQKAYLMLSGTVIIWSINVIATKLAINDLPPFTVGFIRYFLTSAVLIGMLKSNKKSFVIPPRSDWVILIILGLVGIFGAMAFFLFGIHYSTATNGGLIMAWSPVVTVILSALLLKVSINRFQAFGIVVSLLGVMVVITKGSWTILANLNFNVGDVFFVLSQVLLSLYFVLSQKILDRYSALELSTYASIIGALAFLPFIFYEHPWTNPTLHVSIYAWFAIGFLGLVGSTMGNLFWIKGIEIVGANRAGIFQNIIPICTMFLSVIFLGEKITLPNILGAIIVILGVYLNSLRTSNIRVHEINTSTEKG